MAADHYHHWKEDVDLMAELGLKVYRMGFAWSRIMPDATCTPNPEGLAFYDRLIDYLLEKGIEPLVTLYHFECPQALVDAFGGWLDRKMIDAYLKYAEVCGWALARAHAKSGDPWMISGYLGRSEAFDEAVARFAVTYADLAERDHARLKAAVQSGRIAVQLE